MVVGVVVVVVVVVLVLVVVLVVVVVKVVVVASAALLIVVVVKVVVVVVVVVVVQNKTSGTQRVDSTNVVKLVTFDPELRAVAEIGEGSRGLTAGRRLNCSSRGLVSLGVVSVVESCV
ncbi:hypothetical protein ElyMa_001486900 [Elysia marginata]|uniref:Uncharacterized protein n=1 Tax=Elysia marginata TaxID=1093978 RepID=A0AAV4J7T3_9GAST|nr:hypothetical protein ElyMa_001486900 [Elysia marginata]